jgi:hypothetical protein
MKKVGVLIILVTMAILLFVKGLPMQAKFFLGAFGFGLGIVLIGISGVKHFEDM